MKQFFLSLLLVTLSFSSLAQLPCNVDLIVSNQGYDFTVIAVSDSMTTPITSSYTWSVDGTNVPFVSGDTLIFTGVVGSTHNVCVTVPCDTNYAEFCTTFFVDSIGGNPLDSLEEGCLVGIYTYGQNGYLSASTDFDGMLYDVSNLSWTIDGVANPSLQGDYLYTPMSAGTYYVCATYDSDSCLVTFCDSVVVTDPVNLDAGCLVNVTESHIGGQYFFSTEFQNPSGGFLSDLTWTVDGIVASGVTGPYFTQVFADGDYTICASYTTDSCANVICIDITADNSIIIGNDSTIYIDSIEFGDWIITDWDSIYIDSTLLDEIADWDIDEWSDSLVDLIFGDSLNIGDLDSNDIYVIIDGLTQEDIDSLFTLGAIGFNLDDLDELWEDFLEDNEGIESQDYTFNDLLNLFENFIEGRAAQQLTIDEVDQANIDIFFNPHSGILNINSDNIGLVNVYNIQGQRVLSVNDNNPQINLSSINTGLYILSIEINGKLYSHKIVK